MKPLRSWVRAPQTVSMREGAATPNLQQLFFAQVRRGKRAPAGRWHLSRGGGGYIFLPIDDSRGVEVTNKSLRSQDNASGDEGGAKKEGDVQELVQRPGNDNRPCTITPSIFFSHF